MKVSCDICRRNNKNMVCKSCFLKQETKIENIKHNKLSVSESILENINNLLSKKEGISNQMNEIILEELKSKDLKDKIEKVEKIIKVKDEKIKEIEEKIKKKRENIERLKKEKESNIEQDNTIEKLLSTLNVMVGDINRIKPTIFDSWVDIN